jgi:hypothetical protein
MSWTIKGNGTGQDLLYSQAGSPALDLRFAATKSLNDYVSGTNRITFTRASTATYVGANGLIQTAASNEARFTHNPTTGESLGLLVEEARSNLVAYSEQFDNVWWTKDNTTIATNVTTGPDGTTTADKIVETTASSSHSVYRNAGTLTNAIYTYSVFLKKAERNWAYVRLATVVGQGAYFNLNTGTIGTIESGITATMQNAGNGWYRCSVSITASTLPWYPSQGPTIGDNTSSYTGDGSSGIFAWGAQLELGAFPTSYIPTTTTSVARAADVVSITGSNFSNWYNQTQGTMFAITKGAAKDYVIARNSDGSNLIALDVINTATVLRGAIYVSGSPTLSINTGSSSLTAGNTLKSSMAYQLNNAAIAANSSLFATGSPSSIPTLSDIFIGNLSGSSPVNGTISRFVYWPTRLANTTLQTITQ